MRPELEPGHLLVLMESAVSERRNPDRPPNLLLLAVARPAVAVQFVAALVGEPVSSCLELQTGTAAVLWRADQAAALADKDEAAA